MLKLLFIHSVDSHLHTFTGPDRGGNNFTASHCQLKVVTPWIVFSIQRSWFRRAEEFITYDKAHLHQNFIETVSLTNIQHFVIFSEL